MTWKPWCVAAAGLAALGAVGYGLWLIYPPLTWIFGGVVGWRMAARAANEGARK